MRVWFKPSAEWLFQVSHGFLVQPEGVRNRAMNARTTASGSWMRKRPNGFTAVGVAYGRNDKSDGAFNALLAEATDQRGRWSAYGRYETVQVETGLLQTGTPGLDEPPSTVTAVTGGVVRVISRWGGFEIGELARTSRPTTSRTLRADYGTHPVLVSCLSSAEDLPSATWACYAEHGDVAAGCASYPMRAVNATRGKAPDHGPGSQRAPAWQHGLVDEVGLESDAVEDARVSGLLGQRRPDRGEQRRATPDPGARGSAWSRPWDRRSASRRTGWRDEDCRRCAGHETGPRDLTDRPPGGQVSRRSARSAREPLDFQLLTLQLETLGIAIERSP